MHVILLSLYIIINNNNYYFKNKCFIVSCVVYLQRLTTIIKKCKFVNHTHTDANFHYWKI